jgi:glycosyltransferase involved in cell wall biosynthesis
MLGTNENNSNPKLSIVTICYNNIEGLKATSKSLSQVLKLNIEWVIIDGGSQDGTKQILKDLGATQVVSEADKGIYDAMNKGLTRSSGEYVMFLNSGDTLTSFSAIQLLFNDDFDYSILYSDLILKSQSGATRIWKSGSYRKFLPLIGWMAPHPTFISKRKLALSCPFDITKTIAADYHSMLLQFNKTEDTDIYYHPRFTVTMELGGVSNNNFKNIFVANLQVLKSLRQVYGYYPFWVMALKPMSKLFQYRIFKK